MKWNWCCANGKSSDFSSACRWCKKPGTPDTSHLWMDLIYHFWLNSHKRFKNKYYFKFFEYHVSKFFSKWLSYNDSNQYFATLWYLRKFNAVIVSYEASSFGSSPFSILIDKLWLDLYPTRFGKTRECFLISDKTSSYEDLLVRIFLMLATIKGNHKKRIKFNATKKTVEYHVEKNKILIWKQSVKTIL